MISLCLDFSLSTTKKAVPNIRIKKLMLKKYNRKKS